MPNAPPLREWRGVWIVRSEAADVGSLQALGALLDVELDLLVLGQVAVAVTRDRLEVRENVFAAVVGSDEAEALVGVKPLNSSSCHDGVSFGDSAPTPFVSD